MYLRKLLKNGQLSRTQADRELEAIHDMAHYYTIRSCHVESEKSLASRYHEQEKRLFRMLLNTCPEKTFKKLAAEYLMDYPEPFHKD